MTGSQHWTDVLENRDLSQDGRIQVRHGDMTFQLADYPTRASWEARAEHLRKRILVSTGLWPTPERCALNATCTGEVEGPDYSVQNIYFESLPGFFVTGNLYLPKGQAAPFPAVANPHGHWAEGRLVHQERGSVPARCISFARQGYVAFAYDMIGYNDSGLQVPHTYGGEKSGYLWGLSLMGLQLWNSIRVIDYLSSLPQVNPDRIGCTGASGGGTQTFLLMTVDSRVKVAAPVNMISAHFQGGCLCENAPTLRLDCFNVEFGAMMAPRPLLMVSATGDWTANTPTVEYPAIKRIYDLYGAPDNVASVQVDAPHNYNLQSREAVYAWFGRWLLGEQDPERLKERPIEPPDPQSMLVFPDKELPASALTGDELLNLWQQAADAQIESLVPRDAASLQAYRQVMGTAYRYALNVRQPVAGDLRIEIGQQIPDTFYGIETVVLGQGEIGEQIPAILLTPEQATGVVLLVHPNGKSALCDGDTLLEPLSGLLESGLAVLLPDLFGCGELSGLTRDKGTRHFYTFNRSDTALRIQDILTSIAFLQTRYATVHLVGLGAAGPWCLLARAVAEGVRNTVVDADGFAGDDATWAEHLFVPHLRRAGDFRTAAALIAPGQLCVHHLSTAFPTDWFRRIYEVAGVPGALQLHPEPLTLTEIASRCVPIG